MNFSENLKKYRRICGFTQSELAERLGVSAQAVSKWETEGSYPDATLLVPLASLLEISLDELFGRQDVPFESLLDGLSRLLYDSSVEDRYPIAWDTVCRLQKAICAAYAQIDLAEIPNYRSEFRGRSALVMNEGISYLSSGNAPVFLLCPKGEGLTAADISDGYEILSRLADPQVFRAFVYLQTKTVGFLFDGEHLSLACEIPSSEISRVTETLEGLSLVRKTTVSLNGTERIFFSVTKSALTVPLLTVLRELGHGGPYAMSGFLRTQPLLTPSSFE